MNILACSGQAEASHSHYGDNGSYFYGKRQTSQAAHGQENSWSETLASVVQSNPKCAAPSVLAEFVA